MKRKLFLIAIAIIGISFAIAGNASAVKGNKDDLMKIALARGVRKCYISGDAYIKSSGVTKAAFDAEGGGINALLGASGNAALVFVPTQVGNTVENTGTTGISCKLTFSGTDWKDKIKGFTKIYSTPVFLSGYGYVATDGVSEEVKTDTATIKVNVKDASGKNTTEAIATDEGGGLKCSGKRKTQDVLGETSTTWEGLTCSGTRRIKYQKDDTSIEFLIESKGSYVSTRMIGVLGETEVHDDAAFKSVFDALSSSEGNTTLGTVLTSSQFQNMVNENAKKAFGKVYDTPKAEISIENSTTTSGQDTEYKFATSDTEVVASIAINSITKGAKTDYYTVGKKKIDGIDYGTTKVKWTKPYIYSLYYEYLSWAMNDATYKIEVKNCKEGKPEGAAYVFRNTKDQYCEVVIPSDKEAILDVAKATITGEDLAAGRWKDILEWFNDDSNYEGFADNDYANQSVNSSGQMATPDPPSGTTKPEYGTGNDTDKCYDQSGALGWVICPLINGLQDFIVHKYGEWVEPALKMETALFKSGDESANGTYRAWDVFRIIANLVFIVLFIIVIFSQVTGIGIDNYGVKKAIPKLIMSALLINLSFIICQGAIDVSNITGQGIGGLFQSITEEVGYPDKINIDGTEVSSTDQGSWKDGATWGTSFAQNRLGNSLLIIVVCGLGVAAIMSKGLAILIPILMLFIAVAVAVFTLIAILGIRQAAAVLLVVVSPLAFVCYILPNTKSLFDKWFNSFKGILLAYPICSALVYGGDMAGTILLNAANGSTWVIIAAAGIGIAPIFIIPKVIKNSVGAISGAIANFGAKASGYARGKSKDYLNKSAIAHRANYKQYIRGQKQAARTANYSAKQGQKTIQKYTKNGQNPALLSAAKRRKYNIAMGSVNAANNDATNAFISSFNGASPDSIHTTLMNATKRDRFGNYKLDSNMIVGGLSAITDEDKLTRTIKELSGTKEFKEVMAKDPALQQRVADVMRGRKDSIINQSIGKLMGQGYSMEQIYADDMKLLKDKVQGAGTSVIASQDKDVWATEGAEKLFSKDQKREALTVGFTGAKAAKVGQMMAKTSDEEIEEIVGDMTPEQLHMLNSSTVQVAKTDAQGNVVKDDQGNVVYEEKEVGSLAAIGKGDFNKGAAIVREKAKAGIASLNSDDGKQLRTEMQDKVKNAIGVINDGGTADGGAPAPNPNPGGSGSISGGIDVNNMTADDMAYITWQHDRNPAPGASTETVNEGGMPIPHGDSAPTAPDLHSISDTGTFRNAQGEVIRERAKEGNRFDYYPKQQGETNDDYKMRGKYEKALAAYGAANPRKPGETSRDYYDRIKTPSYEEWRASGGGVITGPAGGPTSTPKPEPAKTEPKTTPPASESAQIIIPHEAPKPDVAPKIITSSETPELNPHIHTSGDKPNPDAHIHLSGDRPNPNAHIDIPGDKPNPNAHIDLSGDAKPDIAPKIEIAPAPIGSGTARQGTQSHYNFGPKFTPGRRSFGGTGSGAEGTGAGFNANRRQGGKPPTISTNHHH